jgi:hypothetical protein
MQQFYDENDDQQQYGDYYPDDDYSRRGGKFVLFIFAYFLLVAILVYPATRMHIGMVGILYAIAGAVIILAMLAGGFLLVKRMIASFHLSRGQWARFLFGYTSGAVVVDADTDSYSSRGEQGIAPAAGAMILSGPYNLDGDGESDDELPTEIIEPDGLYLADTFMPSIASVLGTTMLFCGIRRAGKSNGMAVLAEEIGRYGVPVLLCDTEDEYSPLGQRRYLPRGFVAIGDPRFAGDLLRQGIHTVQIDKAGAYNFGATILQEGLQVVLNLKSFEDADEAGQVMCEVIAGMADWEASRPNASRIPCHIFLDEAHRWLPQNDAERLVEKDTLHLLQRTFFHTLVSGGGKYGFGVALATQRISALDKQALQSVWKFLFLQTEQVDIDRYRAQGLLHDDVVSLRPGECFVFSPQVIGFRVQMRERRSPHLGHTPGLAQLQAHQRSMRPVEQVREQVAQVMGTKAGAGEEPQTEPEVPTLPSQVYPTMNTTASASPKLSKMQQQVMNAWEQGHKAHREIAAYLRSQGFPVSDSAAYRALIELETMGYLVRAKKAIDA